MRTVPETATVRQDTTADHLTTLALCQAYRLAKAVYPETERMRNGLRLALAGQVVLHENGTATVHSQYGTTTYTVNGTCSCPDAAKAPKGQCKHRWAKALSRKAEVLLMNAAVVSVQGEPGERCPACGQATVVEVPVWGKHTQDFARYRRCLMTLEVAGEAVQCGWRSVQ